RAGRTAAVEKPGVPVRTVAPDLVDQNFEPERMRPRHQPVEIVEGAEYRIDSAEIGNVVAEIAHRRDEERRDPDGIDAEPGEVIEFANDSFDVADAVIVAVEK